MDDANALQLLALDPLYSNEYLAGLSLKQAGSLETKRRKRVSLLDDANAFSCWRSTRATPPGSWAASRFQRPQSSR